MTVGWLREAAMTVLGLTLAMAPLALWVAWTEAIYYAVLLVFALALALFTLLCRT
jgi:hypothetical protein